MDNDLFVSKRDGSNEETDLEKIHRIIAWATEELSSFSTSRFDYQQHKEHCERLKNCYSFSCVLSYLIEYGLKEKLALRWLVVIKAIKVYLANLGRKTYPVFISITYEKLLQFRLQCRSPPHTNIILNPLVQHPINVTRINFPLK